MNERWEVSNFPADFVVIDIFLKPPDPRVPSNLFSVVEFLKDPVVALIDVYEANRIDIMIWAFVKNNLKNFLGFSIWSRVQSTPYYIQLSLLVFSTLTKPPFRDSGLIFSFSKKADSFLAIEDDQLPGSCYPTYDNLDGDILLLKTIINSDPPPPPPNQEIIFPENSKSLTNL
ncbi:hypothetical protein Tco_0923432 [Tanacetum coccineum]|uniref:Uncharacterized protein n=1 Tax=Tanacetum coccineum TaxID=301880 RepID=A0ABQ5D4A7_9ASTR